MPINMIREFLKLESAGGILLVASAGLAMALANSPLAGLYQGFLDVPLEFRLGTLSLAKPLFLWINEGLMAIFFLLIGLEVKREVREGSLSKPAQIAFPGLAALGGMAVPALIYVAVNWGHGETLGGWAIPAATDIAFALGVLSLLGPRVPGGLKVFLMVLAIIDDLGAIVIIAIFYSSDLAPLSLLLAALAVLALFALNRLGVRKVEVYILVGLFLWLFVMDSGVHATLAGVVLAWAIPLKSKGSADPAEPSPLRQLEHALHPWVAYGILPLFAFANAGVLLGGLSPRDLLNPLPLGVAAGLFLGKQCGVFGFSWLGVKLGLFSLPRGTSWFHLYGVSVLCGIGFTMSLFIGSLAFEHAADSTLAQINRLGILMGSLLSATVGYALLKFALRARSSSS